VIILTWDHDVIQEFWLLREYVPAAAETDARLAVPVNTLGAVPSVYLLRT
jgi:hypothetical protein